MAARDSTIDTDGLRVGRFLVGSYRGGVRQCFMPSPNENLAIVRRYLETIENGAFGNIAELFTPDMTMEQLPNRIYPKGLRQTLPEMAEGFEKGRKLFSRQTYEIRTAVANEKNVAVEVVWTGILAISFGNISAGSEMRAYSAMFFEFNDGKIARQRNYDCFEPW